MVEVQRLEIVFTNALKVMEVGDEAHATGHALLTVKYERFTITMEGDHVMYTLPVDHTVRMQVAYTDAAGNAATIDGDVEWESSNEAIATVEVDTGDSTQCRVVPAGELGQVQIKATCDADLGDGVRELATLADIEIVGGEAVAGTITPSGEPDPKAPHVEHRG
jgi:hypothetical protein